MKIIDEGSVWGFVSMWEGVLKGSLICKDLLKGDKDGILLLQHARGNIFDGSDKCSGIITAPC